MGTIPRGRVIVIKDHGLAVPDDMSVVSINDIPFAATADPPLTTVHMPAREMGMLAMQALLEIVHGREPPRDVVLNVELMVRQSAGQPKAQPATAGERPGDGGDPDGQTHRRGLTS